MLNDERAERIETLKNDLRYGSNETNGALDSEEWQATVRELRTLMGLPPLPIKEVRANA